MKLEGGEWNSSSANPVWGFPKFSTCGTSGSTMSPLGPRGISASTEPTELIRVGSLEESHSLNNCGWLLDVAPAFPRESGWSRREFQFLCRAQSCSKGVKRTNPAELSHQSQLSSPDPPLQRLELINQTHLMHFSHPTGANPAAQTCLVKQSCSGRRRGGEGECRGANKAPQNSLLTLVELQSHP